MVRHLYPGFRLHVEQVFGSHGGRRAGGPWSRSKVLLDHHTDSSSTHMTRVFWSPNDNSQYILTPMGDKRTLVVDTVLVGCKCPFGPVKLVRIANKYLIDYILQSLEVAQSYDLPIQIHTGVWITGGNQMGLGVIRHKDHKIKSYRVISNGTYCNGTYCKHRMVVIHLDERTATLRKGPASRASSDGANSLAPPWSTAPSRTNRTTPSSRPMPSTVTAVTYLNRDKGEPQLVGGSCSLSGTCSFSSAICDSDRGTIATGFASYAPSEDSRQNEGFNTRMKETNDNIDNNTKIDMTTQIMSSAKESGQSKRGMSSSLSSNDSSLSSSDSSSTDDDHITKKKVLMFVVPNVTNYFRNYVVKNLCRDSSMTDHRWVFEILNGHPIRCYQMFRMKKLVFLELCDILETNQPGYVHNYEERSKHSGETISRHFHSVLEVVCMFAKDIFKPIDSSFRDTPNEILKDARYRPYFRDCIGAIDEVYIGRKGYTTTNVMVVCDFRMCFTFVWAGWEGSAYDTKIFMEALRKPALHFPYPPQGKYYLVDSGYPTFMGFLGPYKKTRYHLLQFIIGPRIRGRVEVFNYYHSSLQSTIECVFGLCKARCKILGNMPPFDLKTQNQIIVACMAIHNFIQRNDKSDGEFDSLDEDNEYIDIDDDESEVGPSTTT
ncbi:hypothetical protein JHK87_050609 [Glycine soja]|nr:hypothetical protein JHK87_050609 [Glycine soja]